MALARIKDIELEISRTQVNKATNSHLMRLRARLVQLRSKVFDEQQAASAKGGGEGFEVAKAGNARVALIGFPSVGKSTLMSTLTNTVSEAADYEFTTLTAVPGNVYIEGTKIQLLDLPGIIEGAAHGKGRGRQVIACAKSSDLVMIVLDAEKEGVKSHRSILERELELVGIRLNQRRPDVSLKLTKTGGIVVSTAQGVELTQLTDDPQKAIAAILSEHKIRSAEILFREDCSAEQLIDVVMGDKIKYLKCMYVWNKIDRITIEELDELMTEPEHMVACSGLANMNLDNVLKTVWNKLDMTRVYTKRRGQPPDLSEPTVLTEGRGGITVKALCERIHKSLVDEFGHAKVYGRSAKHSPQRVGLQHILADEDVVEIVKRVK